MKLLPRCVSPNSFWKRRFRKVQNYLFRYPNDGVLLIDVKKYNEYKILDDINEIAMANGKGRNPPIKNNQCIFYSVKFLIL